MIFDKEKHKNNDSYPDKESFKQLFFYKAGNVYGPFSPNDEELEKFNKKDSRFVKEIVFDENAYREAVANWSRKQKLCETVFRKDLFDAYGFKDDRINEVIYSKAWEDEHSCGMYGVENKFIDYVEFAQKILDAQYKEILK